MSYSSPYLNFKKILEAIFASSTVAFVFPLCDPLVGPHVLILKSEAFMCHTLQLILNSKFYIRMNI